MPGEYCLELAAQPLAVSGNAMSIAVGDFNEDDLLDLAVANIGGIVVFSALSPAQFEQPGMAIALPDAVSVRAADIDGDGHQDLAVGRQIPTNLVTVLWGSGVGTFPQQVSVANPVSPTVSAIAVGDIDRDSRQDILGASSSTGGPPVLIVKNAGSRTFSASGTMNLPSGTQGRGVALGDFDGNDHIDIVTGTSVQNDYGATYVYLNDGMGGFGSAIQTTAVPCPGSFAVDCFMSGVSTGSFNGDAFDDVVIAMAGPVPKGVAIELSSGQKGIFSLPDAYPVGMNAGPPTTADINGDGAVDIVLSIPSLDSVTVLLGTGAGSFVSQAPISTSPLGRRPIEIAVADLNADGEADLATANDMTGNVSLILSQP